MFTIEERITETETEIKNLKQWQKSQNGAIREVNKKVDKLQYWIMGVMATSIITLVAALINMGGGI